MDTDNVIIIILMLFYIFIYFVCVLGHCGAHNSPVRFEALDDCNCNRKVETVSREPRFG